MKLVNSEEGRALRLRGVNTRVVEPGTVRRGDAVRKASALRVMLSRPRVGGTQA